MNDIDREEIEKRFNNFDEFATEVSQSLENISRAMENMYRRILALEEHTKINSKLIV